MKKVLLFSVMLVLVVSVALLGCTAAPSSPVDQTTVTSEPDEEETYTFSIQHMSGPRGSFIYNVRAEEFCDPVEVLSDGRITLELYGPLWIRRRGRLTVSWRTLK